MSTAVVVTGGDHVLPAEGAHIPPAPVLRPPDEQPLDAALEETWRLLEQHGYLLVIHPHTLPLPHLHRLHALRSVLESDRIALLPTALPPLGTAVLVRQLRQLAAYDFGPGVLGAAARLLTHYIYAGAVLNSVARLDHVPVPLGAHAKSWLPGAQFAVLASPAPQLLRLGGRGASAGGEEALVGPRFATSMTYAGRQLAPDWVTGTLAPHWRVGAVHEVPARAEAARWWGTGKLVEFAAAIPDPGVLHQLVSSVRRDTCHWCGLELIGERCVFCAAPALPERDGGAGAGAGAGPGAHRGAEPVRGAHRSTRRDPRQVPPRQELPREQPPRQEPPPTHYGNAVVADPRGL
ncbi:hypothetical protein [Streptomyces sp. ODS28]|uniref:hypothetical protein n=1 Tax=Streptomyces sp. ODS28 TaxID=3136688 RepID=UPI0031E799A3